MTAEREGAEVEAVLAAHRLTASGGCSCGWTVPRNVPFIAALEAHTAEALAPLIAEQARAAAERALREAADAWQVGGWSNVLLPKPAPPAVPVIAYSNRVLDWLRDRADTYAQGGERP